MSKINRTPNIRRTPGVRSAVKAALVIALLLLLLIPLGMIRSLVSERELRAASVANEIVDGAGGRLDFIGPVLVLPYEISVREQSGDVWTTVVRREEAYLLPDRVEIGGHLDTEYRSRGIYRVPVYTARLDIRGTFPAVGDRLFPQGARPLTGEYRLAAGVADMRGIRDVTALSWNGETRDFGPDSGTTFLGGGITAPLDGLPLGSGDSVFSWAMDIGGGESVLVTPLGRNSELELTGTWPSPSFGGAVLPEERSLGDEGFRALWRIPEVSRPILPHWTSRQPPVSDLRSHALSVALKEPVGTYARTERSVKYGALFLLIPFVVFFLFEALGSARIHPVQYLLAGGADVLFYLLLLAVSEHMDFNRSYILAASAVTVLISLYSRQAAGKAAAVMPVVLGAAYTWLWVTLQSEDYALLIGSVGLFAVIALVMFVTRRVDWYAAGGVSPSTDVAELGTEGQKGQGSQFEMLAAEGDADDGDGEEDPGDDMTHRQLPAEQEDPNEIADGTGGAELSDENLPPEGPEDE